MSCKGNKKLRRIRSHTAAVALFRHYNTIKALYGKWKKWEWLLGLHTSSN